MSQHTPTTKIQVFILPNKVKNQSLFVVYLRSGDFTLDKSDNLMTIGNTQS